MNSGHDNESSTSAAGPTAQLLTFIVDGEEYGVDILRVQEIRGWSNPMPIPNTPSYIKGVINIRGDVVPIADLRERLGLAQLSYGPTTVVIVLRISGAGRDKVMGIIVDAMSDVTNVQASSIKSPPSFGSPTESAIVSGIVTLESKMITILNVDAIFGVSNPNQSAAA